MAFFKPNIQNSAPVFFLPNIYTRFPYIVYSSTMNIEVVDTFNIFIVFHQNTRRHITEEHNCDNHHYADLRSPLVIEDFMVEEHNMADEALQHFSMEDKKNQIKLHPKKSKANLVMLRQNWRFELRYCVVDCAINYVYYAKVKSLELICQPIRLSYVIFNIYIINTNCVELRARCSVTEIVRLHNVTSQKTVILVFSTMRLTNPYV